MFSSCFIPHSIPFLPAVYTRLREVRRSLILWLFLFAFLAPCSLFSQGYVQPLNAHWREWLGFRDLQGITTGPSGEYFVWSKQGILRYRVLSGEVERIGRLQGLSHSSITAVDFSQEHGLLVVAYEDGAIDLMSASGNIQHIITLESLTDRVKLGMEVPVQSITTYGDYAYCLNAERIYVVSLTQKSVLGSVRVWHKNLSQAERLHSLAVVGVTLYVGGATGLWSIPLPVSFSDGWFTRVPGPDMPVQHVVGDAKRAVGYCLGERSSDYSVWSLSANGVSLLSEDVGEITGCALGEKGLYVGRKNSLYFYSETGGGGQQIYVESGEVLPFILRSGSVVAGSSLLMATGGRGLLMLPLNNAGGVGGGVLSTVYCKGPLEREVRDIVAQGDGVAICHGDGTFPLSVYFSEEAASGEERLDVFPNYHGGQCLAIIDAQRGHYLVGTLQQGLLEVQDGAVRNVYNQSNSPLVALPDGVSVAGVYVGRDGAWWLFNPGNPNPLIYRSPSGDWAAFSSPLRSSDAGCRAIIKEGAPGQLWISLAESPGLLFIDTEVFIHSSGRSGYAYTEVHSRQMFSASQVRDFDFTPDNGLAIATGDGIALSQNIDRFPVEGRLNFSLPVFPSPENEEFEAYILDRQPLLSMAVAPGGRFWVGTEHNGLYQVDVSEKAAVRYFSNVSTPLPSPRISRLLLHSERGLLYVGTPNGMVSLSIDALIPSQDFSQAKVYPNPLPPGYVENVTIDGLMENTTVKITDIAGRLVRELQSEGGRILWDQRNGVGRLVGSGVYLLFCTSPNAKQHRILKLAIVR